MNKRLIIAGGILIFLAVTHDLFAKPSVTLQQIKITNMLWNSSAGNPGSTETNLIVKYYYNGNSVPCYTTFLPFQESITVSTGTGRDCESAVNTISFTPVAGPSGIGPVYTAPTDTSLTKGKFTVLLSVQSGTAPVFSSANGALITPGTASVTKTES